MDSQERLLRNLDTIDRGIAKAALSLITISMFYLAFCYGVSKEIEIPLINLKLKENYPYYFGIPIISLLSQYILVCGVGTYQIEKKLKKEGYKPTNPILRYPTFFGLIFVMGATAKGLGQKLLYIFHLFIVLLFYIMLPLFTCFAIFKRLLQSDVNWAILWINASFLVIIVIELLVSLILSISKLIKDTKHKI